MVWVCEFCNNNNADSDEVCEICGHAKAVTATPKSTTSKTRSTRSGARAKSTPSRTAASTSKTAARTSSASSKSSSSKTDSLYSKTSGATKTASSSYASARSYAGTAGSEYVGKTKSSYATSEYGVSKSSSDTEYFGRSIYRKTMARYKRLHRFVCLCLLVLCFLFGQAVQYSFYNRSNYVPVLTELLVKSSLDVIDVNGYLLFSLLCNLTSVVLAYYIACYYVKRNKFIAPYFVVVPLALTLGIVPSVISTVATVLLIILSATKSKWIAPIIITLFIAASVFCLGLIAVALGVIF